MSGRGALFSESALLAGETDRLGPGVVNPAEFISAVNEPTNFMFAINMEVGWLVSSLVGEVT